MGSHFFRDFFIHLQDLRRQNLEGDNGDKYGVHAARRPFDNADRDFVDEGEGIVGVGQIVRRNAENVVSWLEMLATQLQDHVGWMFSRQMVLPLYNFFHLTCLYAYRSLCFAYLKIHFL